MKIYRQGDVLLINMNSGEWIIARGEVSSDASILSTSGMSILPNWFLETETGKMLLGVMEKVTQG